jgi:hypothetical protein
MIMRSRFNAKEKQLLQDLERSNILDVEVHYASGNWIAFRLDSTTPQRDTIGGWRLMGTVTGPSTRVIGKGDRFGATPGNIRPLGSNWRVS